MKSILFILLFLYNKFNFILSINALTRPDGGGVSNGIIIINFAQTKETLCANKMKGTFCVQLKAYIRRVSH